MLSFCGSGKVSSAARALRLDKGRYQRNRVAFAPKPMRCLHEFGEFPAWGFSFKLSYPFPTCLNQIFIKHHVFCRPSKFYGDVGMSL